MRQSWLPRKAKSGKSVTSVVPETNNATTEANIPPITRRLPFRRPQFEINTPSAVTAVVPKKESKSVTSVVDKPVESPSKHVHFGENDVKLFFKRQTIGKPAAQVPTINENAVAAPSSPRSNLRSRNHSRSGNASSMPRLIEEYRFKKNTPRQEEYRVKMSATRIDITAATSSSPPLSPTFITHTHIPSTRISPPTRLTRAWNGRVQLVSTALSWLPNPCAMSTLCWRRVRNMHHFFDRVSRAADNVRGRRWNVMCHPRPLSSASSRLSAPTVHHSLPLVRSASTIVRIISSANGCSLASMRTR